MPLSPCKDSGTRVFTVCESSLTRVAETPTELGLRYCLLARMLSRLRDHRSPQSSRLHTDPFFHSTSLVLCRSSDSVSYIALHSGGHWRHDLEICSIREGCVGGGVQDEGECSFCHAAQELRWPNILEASRLG